MSLDPIGAILTLGIFGAAGWILSRRLKAPVPGWTWVLLVVGLLCSTFVGRNVALVSFFGVGIFVNVALASFLIGVLAGLLFRTSRVRGGERFISSLP